MIIKNLIDDISGPSFGEIINRPDFTTEDFEYILSQYDMTWLYDCSYIYMEYSNNVPFEYVLKNLDKPWDWFILSKNENLTYNDYMKIKELNIIKFNKFNKLILLKNKNFNRTKQIKTISELIELPHELIEIITNYYGPFGPIKFKI